MCTFCGRIQLSKALRSKDAAEAARLSAEALVFFTEGQEQDSFTVLTKAYK